MRIEILNKLLSNRVALSELKGYTYKYLLQEQESAFYAKQALEYYELYPETRDCTQDEYELELGLDYDAPEYDTLTEYPQVTIDYSEDETFIGLEEYKNETRVVQEAVEEVLDEEGFVVQEAVPEVTELVRPYVLTEITDRDIVTLLTGLDGYKAYAKAHKLQEVSNIVVEVDGMLFDGDEDSQNRMTRAVLALVGDEETEWRLAGNSIVPVTQTTLKKAVRLAGARMTEIWMEA